MAAFKPNSEEILWAESAAGGDISDPAAKRTAGYQFEDPWPHEEANFMFRALGRFSDWLSRSAGRFTSPGGSLASTGEGPLASGETLVTGASVWPPTTTAPGPAVTETMVDIDHDGVFAIVLEQGDGVDAQQVHVIDRSGVVATRSWSTGVLAATAQAVACNGVEIAVLQSDGNFEVFDYDGVSQFTGDRVGASTDIAMHNSRVFVCGAAAIATGGTNSREIQAWTLSTGAFAWELDNAFGATVNAITTDGQYVFGGGNTTGGGDTILRVLEGTGAINAQGGSAVVADKNRIVVGPYSIYVLTGSTSPALFEYSRARASVFTQLDTLALGSGNAAGGLAIDDRYIYLATNSILHAIPISAPLDSEWRGFQLAVGNTPWLVSDAQNLWIANNDAGAIQHVTTGRTHSVWSYTGDQPRPTFWFRRRFTPGD